MTPDASELPERIHELAYDTPADALHRAALQLVCSAILLPNGGPIVVGQGAFEGLLRALEERAR